MGTDDEPRNNTFEPDDAFAVLGNETRMEILHTLNKADAPLPFSELREQVGVKDSGQFNYHLGKLEGHFVNKFDGEYSLRQAGQRVIESILSGSVTEAAVLDPTRLDLPCPYCDSDIEISFREERLLIRCTECPGTFPGKQSTSRAFGTLPRGTITLYYLPSAGLQGRTPSERINAVLAYTFGEWITMGNGVCPRCSATVEFEIDYCKNHEPEDGFCERCHSRFPIVVYSECVNCGHLKGATMRLFLISNLNVRTFFESHGVDTLAPDWNDMAVLFNREEAVTETDPFEAEITFEADGDELTVTVDDTLSVTSVSERIRRDPM